MHLNTHIESCTSSESEVLGGSLYASGNGNLQAQMIP